jgi:hypothetical protein
VKFEIDGGARRNEGSESPWQWLEQSGGWVCSEGKGFNIAGKSVVKFKINLDQLGA